MADAPDTLRRAARQLIETDLLMGGDFMPAHRNPLGSPPAACGFAGNQANSVGQSPAASVQTSSVGSPNVRSPAALANQTPQLDGPTMTRDQKAAALNQIDVGEVRGCTRCILHKGRTQTVFGEGAPAAELLFVGEGPGEEEDRQGRPFVGRAGQLLNQMIAAMGLRREDVYIANVVKCRPPGNRTPLPDESATCAGLYLVRQLQIIRPRAIVTLGNPATQALLGAVLGITKIRGHWQKLRALAGGLEGIPVMPTFHPAYLLRNYTVEVRKMVWGDLQKVMELLGIKKK